MQLGVLTAPNFNRSGICGQFNHKCVVSFGLFGANTRYTAGALFNAEMMSQFYDGWVARFYHDTTGMW